MIDAGILRDDERVELLDGLIVPKMTHKPPHDALVGILDDALRALLPAAWKVRVQSALTTASSEPEPDLAIVRGPLTRYLSHHPHPADVGLVVEVADSSLEKDRREKGPIYAAGGIPTYWIVNILARTFEVYSDPTATGYAARADYDRGKSLAVILDGHEMGSLNIPTSLPAFDG